MAIRSWPFDSVEGDRIHGADFPSRALGEGVIKDGYVPTIDEELVVRANVPAGMSVQVRLGSGWIQGRHFQVYSSPEVINIPSADPSNDRIDRIVARLDLNSRDITLRVITGTPATNPTPPGLTRDLGVSRRWEISLAQVRVRSGVASIAQEDIIDERDDVNVCGKAAAYYVESAGRAEQADSASEAENALRLEGYQQALSAAPNTIVRRDASGRAKVAAPSASDDIARKQEVDAVSNSLSNHAGATSVHGATSSNVPSRLIIRDSSGRASVAAPISSDHIARKAEVDSVVSSLSSHMNASSVHNATSSATAGRLIIRDGSGRAQVAAPAVAGDIARKAEIDAHASLTTGIHGAGSGFYVAKTRLSTGLPHWLDIQSKPSLFPPSSHTHSGDEITSIVKDAQHAEQADNANALANEPLVKDVGTGIHRITISISEPTSLQGQPGDVWIVYE